MNEADTDTLWQRVCEKLEPRPERPTWTDDTDIESPVGLWYWCPARRDWFLNDLDGNSMLAAIEAARERDSSIWLSQVAWLGRKGTYMVEFIGQHNQFGFARSETFLEAVVRALAAALGVDHD